VFCLCFVTKFWLWRNKAISYRFVWFWEKKTVSNRNHCCNEIIWKNCQKKGRPSPLSPNFHLDQGYRPSPVTIGLGGGGGGNPNLNADPTTTPPHTLTSSSGVLLFWSLGVSASPYFRLMQVLLSFVVLSLSLTFVILYCVCLCCVVLSCVVVVFVVVFVLSFIVLSCIVLSYPTHHVP
jgi:hypothetical protein